MSPKGRATWLSLSFWAWEPGQSTHQRQAAPCKWVGQPVLPGSSPLGVIFFQASSSQALPLKHFGQRPRFPLCPHLSQTPITPPLLLGFQTFSTLSFQYGSFSPSPKLLIYFPRLLQ